MKRKLLSLLLIILSFSLFGKPVDENRAKIVGLNFLHYKTNSNLLKNASELQLTYVVNSKIGNSTDERVMFYVFNVGSNGFVIVSGDDNVMPILGYSDEGSFDSQNIPQSVQKWLDEYKSQIRFIIDKNILATEEIQKDWANNMIDSNPIVSKSTQSVNPLIQTKWNQNPYENALCPYDTTYNQLTVTGCPATAMAQIMKYWNYPVTGSGFHSYNHQKYGTLSANFGSTNYQWSSMPNIINSPNNAVATLMYQCGVAVEMNYGVAATGGSASYVIIAAAPSAQQTSENAYKTYFGYNATTLQGLKRLNYSDNNWITLLKNELDQSRPIQYAGFGSSGGHTFVCDGYDNNNYFHMNWGWAGNSDGYFQINALNPLALGTGGGSGGFNSGQQALIGIQPPSGGIPQNYDLQLYSNISMPSTQIWFKSAFNLTVDIANLGSGSFAGQYGAAIFDHNYKFVDFMEVKSNMTLNSSSHYTNPLTFSSAGSAAYVPGIYYVAMFYKTTTKDWTNIGNGNYTNLKQFEIYYSSAIETNSAFSITTNGGKLIQGQSATVNVDLKNTGASTFFGQIRVNLASLDGTWVQNIQILNETNGLQYNYHYTNGNNFTGSITVAPGTYLMEVAYKEQGSSSWYYAGSSNYSNPIYVIVEAPGFSPDQYENNNIAGNAYTLPITFSSNTASKNTVGSNLHIGTDDDYYKINLPTGYNYTISARLHDSYNNGNGNTYSVDGLFSYSTDNGITWSENYDDVMSSNISIQNGGTVLFHAAPYFSGSIGTYLLDMTINRTTLGINENQFIDNIKIYPNPAKDFVTINSNDFEGELNQISIVNIQGQSIFNSNSFNQSKIINLPVNNFSEGIYMLQLQTNKGLITRKLIINK